MVVGAGSVAGTQVLAEVGCPGLGFPPAAECCHLPFLGRTAWVRCLWAFPPPGAEGKGHLQLNL